MLRISKAVFLSILLASAIASPALALPAVVQSDKTTTANTGANISSNNLTTTLGNTLIAFLADYNPSNGASASSANDTPNGGYSNANPSASATSISSNVGVFYKGNAAALSAQPIHGTGTGSSGTYYQTLVSVEVSGVTSSPLDLSAAPTLTTSSATPSVTSGTTAQANEIAFCFVATGAWAGGTFTEGSGWNLVKDNLGVAGTMGLHVSYKLVSGVGTVTCNPTLSVAQALQIGIMTLKGTGSVGSNKLMMQAIP